MNNIKKRGIDKSKLILSISILLTSIILGSFYYVSQVNKQQSIERQQRLEVEQQRLELQEKIKWSNREYIAKRKGECYDIYLKERKNWNNVKDFSYSEVRDVCIIKYQSKEPAKKGEECEKMLKSIAEIKDEELIDIIKDIYFDCLNNWFSKEF